MKVKVVESFIDKEYGVDRKVGSIFECSDERGKELIGYELVSLEENSKSDKSIQSKEQELTKKEAFLNDKEKELIEREGKVAARETKLVEREASLEAQEVELGSLGKVLMSREKDLDLKEEKLKKAESKDKK